MNGIDTSRDRPDVPVALMSLVVIAAVMTGFSRSLGTADILRGSLAGVVCGAMVGWGVLARRMPVLLRPPMAVVGMSVALIAASGDPTAPISVWSRLLTFLSVGLPADGVPGVAMVPCLVAFPLAFGVAWALRRTSMALYCMVVVCSAMTVEVLAGYRGEVRTSMVIAAAATLAVMAMESRLSVSNLPVLSGSTTQVRRQYSMVRALVQSFPVIVVVALASVVVGSSTMYDIRSLVRENGVVVQDPNPLSQVTSLRNAPLESVTDVFRVRWEGRSPGRLRVAVLNAYDGTSWRQNSVYALTGSNLAPDPVARVVAGSDAIVSSMGVDTPIAVSVEILGNDDFAALPVSGRPVAAKSTGLLRFSSRDGLIVSDEDPTVGDVFEVSSSPTLSSTDVGDVGVGVSGDFSDAGDLVECVDSPAVRTLADVFRRQYPNPLERAGELLAWLKLKRVFVQGGVSALGGQSLASVETFLSPDDPDAYRKGNIDSFVSAFALVARCAGLPNRVVVGYTLPDVASPDGVVVRSADITSWVEIPFRDVGWIAFDPIPSASEIQAQLASLSLPEPRPTPAPDVPIAPNQVEPDRSTVVDDSSSSDVLPLAVIAVVASALLWWFVVVPWYVRRRRRRAKSPSTAVLTAWEHVVENLVDRGVPVARSHTPSEVVKVSAGRVPGSVVAALSSMAPMADMGRFAGELCTSEDAESAWQLATQATSGLPKRFAPLATLVMHPGRWWARFRSVSGIEQGGHSWRMASAIDLGGVDQSVSDGIRGVTISSRIGDGSTGTVFKGVVNESSMPVAVKIFRFGPGDDGFSPERFDWECKVASLVSGRPNLPVVYDSGFTSPGDRPFIVTSLYEKGTLLDRVRRDGPLGPKAGLALAIDVAIALEALHQLGVVHADVKPENVFASGGGWVLGDLGSAWLRTSRGPAASLTPPYAAPEVWRGSSPSVSADLYSLALTVMFAVTGQVPIAGNPPDFGMLRSVYPDRRILIQALDADPRRRPSGAREFAEALGESLESEGPSPFTGLSLPTPTIVKQH